MDKSIAERANQFTTRHQEHSQSFLEYEARLESDISILDENLATSNYREKFHHLLCWEELEHARQIAQM